MDRKVKFSVGGTASAAGDQAMCPCDHPLLIACLVAFPQEDQCQRPPLSDIVQVYHGVGQAATLGPWTAMVLHAKRGELVAATAEYDGETFPLLLHDVEGACADPHRQEPKSGCGGICRRNHG